MPRVEMLVGWHIQAAKSQETDVVRDQGGESLEVNDVWTLAFTDYETKDRIQISFRRDARDELVRQLTGGVVLAGGDLPKV